LLLEDLDKKLVWHPYTQMKDWVQWKNRMIVRGEGFYLIDSHGNRYLDGSASMWCNVWGHSRSEIIESMIRQIKELQHSTLFGLSNSPAIELAEKLVKISKGMNHVFYSDNGSTAVEVAMKMALQYWRNKGNRRKVRFISLENGYHGDTIGAMSVGYVSKYFSAYNPILKLSMRLTPPPSMELHSHSELQEYYINKAEKILSRYHNKCCAIIMESGAQIAGAVNIYPHNYQRRIAELCNKYDVLLILDEIASGFGRLGNMVEYIAQGSIPDMVCFGKSLTAGYSPLAVTLCNREIFSRFLGEYSDNKQLYHGHTYTGHPIGCSAALANIKLYVKHHLIERIRSNSIYIKKRLREFDNSYSISDRIRHKGLLGAIDLVNNKKDRKPINVLKKNNMRINYFIDRESLHMGVYLRSLENTIIIVPPLAIDRKNLRLLLDVISQLINKIEKYM